MIPSVLGLAARALRARPEHGRLTDDIVVQLEQARLQVLQMQIQPHFLSGALDAVSTRLESDAAAARTMLRALTSLLAASLQQIDVTEVPLRAELALLDKYLEYQRVRFSNRLDVRTKLGGDTLDARVPPFILQPLVEHTIGCGTGDACPRSVQLSAVRRGSELHLGVASTLQEGGACGSAAGASLALANTRQRLEYLHGSEQRIELLDEEGASSLRVILPFRTAA